LFGEGVVGLKIKVMKLPLGMLTYWVHRFEENHAIISGMWYFKEMHVPSSRDEKINSISDLKSKRCTVLNITGTFSQIKDILSRADRFINAGTNEILQFNKLVEDLINTAGGNAYLFDNIHEITGTSLSIDMSVEVDESMEEIMNEIKKGKPVSVTISADWSLSNVLLNSLVTK
jgi:hypothetical protein